MISGALEAVTPIWRCGSGRCAETPDFIGVLAGVRREDVMGAAHIRAKKGRRRTARGERATARFADSADPGLPPAQGLYDPALESDSCGVGFIADIKGRSSHKLIEDALAILCNLEHRGAVGRSRRAGDGRWNPGADPAQVLRQGRPELVRDFHPAQASGLYTAAVVEALRPGAILIGGR